MSGPTPGEGHDWPLDLDRARSGDKPVYDTPTIDDSVPMQPDTGRQPATPSSRFTYPNPGKHGDLGTTG